MLTIFKKLLAGSIVAMALVGTFVPLTVVNAAAAEKCDCYCTNFNGAKKPVDEKITSDECNTKCTEKKETVAAFACGANQHPSRTPFCFDDAECTAQNGKIDESGYQPPECTTGFKYCYPTIKADQKVTLQVKIGTYATSINFGEYIGVMYKWMVSSAVFIAIIMLMIGGVRYTLGAASDQIAAAKKMMVNAITGLVLLLSAYLILFTVNPDLVSLQVPRLPMIKQVALVDSADCRTLLDDGWKIDFSGPEECGTVGTVKEDDKGGVVPDGTMCNFTKCGGDLNKLCVPGDKPVCLRCEDMAFSNDAGVPPSTNLCSSFNSLRGYEEDSGTYKESSFYITIPNAGPSKGKEIQVPEEQYRRFKQCFYSRDDSVGGNLVSTGSCVLVAFSCDTKYAESDMITTKITDCDGYEGIQVQYKGGSVDLDDIAYGANSGIEGTSSGVGKMIADNAGDFTMGTFCDGGGGIPGDMCRWNRSDREKSCYSSASSATAITGYSGVAIGAYGCKGD